MKFIRKYKGSHGLPIIVMEKSYLFGSIRIIRRFTQIRIGYINTWWVDDKSQEMCGYLLQHELDEINKHTDI
jgi:hypothetical protein